jgi:hypothetical protein
VNRRLLYFVAVIALIFCVGYYGSANVSYESTRGDWADREVLDKGRNLKLITILFEHYKRACSAHDAALVRTTPENFYNPFLWYSYATDPKWDIPYRQPRVQGRLSPPCAYLTPPQS